MRPMHRRLALALAALLAPAGCGASTERLPVVCTRDARDVVAALANAPGAVRLSDGTRLSACVRRAVTDGDRQSVGLALTRAADELMRAVPRSDAAALRLGYLIGAARRGARATNGLQLELVRRLEQVPGVGGPPGARRAAFARGVDAGERIG